MNLQKPSITKRFPKSPSTSFFPMLRFLQRRYSEFSECKSCFSLTSKIYLYFREILHKIAFRANSVSSIGLTKRADNTLSGQCSLRSSLKSWFLPSGDCVIRLYFRPSPNWFGDVPIVQYYRQLERNLSDKNCYFSMIQLHFGDAPIFLSDAQCNFSYFL